MDLGQFNFRFRQWRYQEAYREVFRDKAKEEARQDTGTEREEKCVSRDVEPESNLEDKVIE